MQDSSLLRFLKSFWPKVNRILNILAYYLLRLTRGTIDLIVSQVKKT